MNANEVIATIAGEPVHRNDHVNMGQSSNDVFPSAVHLAALGEVHSDLLPALDELGSALERKSDEFADHVKTGRTHLMDAVPVTLGQEFAGYATQVKLGAQRVRDTLGRVGQIPLGGTATGTGLNTHPEFAAKVREQLSKDTGLDISEPADPFEAQANRDALVELSGALKGVAVSLMKIANDLALMGSGPRAGLAELRLPELQKGSSIMPGKVNPVIPEVVIQVADQVIGNDTAITLGGTQGQFELNVRVPLIARNLLDSIKLLAAASRALDEKCVSGLEPNEEMLKRHTEANLIVATALNEHIGYDKAGEIVKEAAASDRSIREVALEQGVDEATLDEALDHRKMARPHDSSSARRTSALQRDQPLLGQLAHRVGRALAGVARVLDAAVGHLVGAEGRDLVDQDAAELEAPAGLDRAADVAGEDAGLEAELGVVGHVEALVEGLEGVDHRDRAEDLLAPDLGVALGAAQHGRREAAVLVDELAAGEQLGAARDGLVDPLLDAVAVVRGDQRADVGVLAHRVAGDEALDVLDEAGREVVGDRLVQQDPLDRDAALARVREGVDLGLVGGLLPVAVVVDDERRGRAELEVDLLVGGLGADVPADRRRAGEGEGVGLLALDERVADLGARAGDDAEPALGQPGLEQDLGELDGRDRASGPRASGRRRCRRRSRGRACGRPG